MNKYGYTQNRELSWLNFNERVLEESEDISVPLLERLKFCAIFTSNLDEFYRIRVGSIYDLNLVDEKHIDNKSGMTPSEQLSRIYAKTRALYHHRDVSFEVISDALRNHNLYKDNIETLNKDDRKELNKYFKHTILPLVSAQIIDINHPFPHIENKSLNVFVTLKRKNKTHYGLVNIPASLDRLYFLEDCEDIRYLLIEDIIVYYVSEIFTNYDVLMASVISVTRNGDINLDLKEGDEDNDYRDLMKKILKKRNRLEPIRLEIYKGIESKALDYLTARLNISEDQVFISKNVPLDLSYVFKLENELNERERKILLYKEYEPINNVELSRKQSVIKLIDEQPLLLSYPFDSMEPFIDLLREASTDPSVLSIKITIYRTANPSKIIKYLCRASENGKDVTVLVELRARFDEANNIFSTMALEEAGCKVIYGFDNYKVHSKICLITRKKGNRISYITQIGTGNYNEKTSKMYTDLSYITSNPEIGADASTFFMNMTTANLKGEYKHLLVAPNSLRNKICDLIDEEIKKGENGNIIMKFNSLTDLVLINKLVEASQAKVKIKLIIRGICCLLPGIPGISDNIQIISIVGRYLEHSRIYCFGSDLDSKIYISSADLMTRNMIKRVEIAAPITDEVSKTKILHILHVILNDNVKGRKVLSNGNYAKIFNDNEDINSQEYFIEEARQQEHIYKMPAKKHHLFNIFKK